MDEKTFSKEDAIEVTIADDKNIILYWSKYVKAKNKKFAKTHVYISDIISTYVKTLELIFDDKLEWYKNYQRIAYQRRTFLQEWQSNSVSNFTQFLTDILFQKTYWIPFQAPLSADSNDLKETLEQYISTCWASAWMILKIPKAWHLAITMWDCFYRWSIKYYENDIKSYGKKKESKIIKNFNAYADVIDAVNFLYDFVRWPEDSEVFVYRWRETPKKFLWRREAYSLEIKKLINNKINLESITNEWNPFVSKNFEYYKLLKYKEKILCEQDQLFNYSMMDFFNVTPNKNSIYADHECVEFYTKDRIVLCVNGIVIDDIKNPFSQIFWDDIWHPYCRVINKNNPWSEISISLPEQLIDMQYWRDLVENAFYDQIKMDLNPMYIASDNIYFDDAEDWVLNYTPNKIWKVAWTGKMDKFAITSINNNIFTITDYIDNRWYSVAWINRTTAAVWWATPRSAADANYQYEITYDNLRTFAANNSVALNKLSRIWIIEWYYKLPISVQWEYKNKKFQITKAIKDWNLDYNIEFTNETLSAYFMTQHRAWLEAVIRTAWPYQKNASDGMDNYDIRWIMKAWLDSYSLWEFALDSNAAKKRYEEQIKLKTELWVKEAISQAEWQAVVQEAVWWLQPAISMPDQSRWWSVAQWVEIPNQNNTLIL